jgi:uncharacterized membrane protein
MNSTNPQQCQNCGTAFRPDDRFCALCGQKTNIHRLSLHDIWHDAVHYFTHADKGIFALVKDLWIRPGVVAREFVLGHRAKHFKPLNFFLLVAGILVLVTSNLHTYENAGSRQFEKKAGQTLNMDEKKALETYSKRIRQVNGFVGRYSNVVNMMATPLITLIFFLFYRKEPFNYIEHLVGNLYFVGFTMIFYALLVAPLIYYIDAPGFDLACIGLFFAFEIWYKGRAYYQFIGRTGGKHLAKAMAVSVATTVFWAAFTASMISIYIRTGFGIVK